ncbi:hypothetical protein MMG00_10655 [Ignatzschineria rhizosphaerae]|uniref:DUF1834 domain-containing protein n=1 Tax=Ignatzschineria rhizosphaerae TaxID=2923279 RepID=A0ABY3WYI0_9GAMM|nr:hypothetical protein [Ignatzschineria rhizosphaerae]UNM95669.1 hypothetical protein MMG00_10655 [Ignatzschineria rhizosphaerae]
MSNVILKDSDVTIMQKALVAFLDKEFHKVVSSVSAFDGVWTNTDIQSKVQNPPALFVTWLGNRVSVANEKVHTWSILLFMRTTSGAQTEWERELASHIIEFIEKKLHNQKLKNENGPIGAPLQHIKSDNLWHTVEKGSGFTLYGITFEQSMYPVYDDLSDMDNFLTYYEKVVGGDVTLIETLAKPNEPM